MVIDEEEAENAMQSELGMTNKIRKMRSEGRSAYRGAETPAKNRSIFEIED